MNSRTLALWAAALLLSTFTSAQTPATFTTDIYPTGPAARFSYAVDLNNDGTLDVVTVSLQLPATFTILIANGDRTFRAPVTTTLPNNPQGTTPMVSGDFNSDGKTDLLFQIAGQNKLVFYAGNGDGSLQAPVTISVALPAGQHFGGTPMAVADFNGDGKLDIVATANTNTQSSIYVLPGNGVGGFGAPRTILNLPSGHGAGNDIVAGDFDADAKADVAFGETFNCVPGICQTRVHVLYGNGAFGFAYSTPFSTATSYIFNSGDLNSDGRSDLFGTVDSKTLVVLYGQSGRTFRVQRIAAQDAPTGETTEMAMADFNGDGRMDLVSGSATDEAFFLANGSGGFTEQHYALGSFQFKTAAVVGDFNRDTKPDVVFNVQNTGSTSTLYELVNTTETGDWGGCAYPNAGQGTHVCLPTSATSTSPVIFSASANSFLPLRKLELWVDGTKIAEQYHVWDKRAWFRFSKSLATGSHRGTFYAANYDNYLQKTSFTFTVGGPTTGCAQPSALSVVICSPANGSTVGNQFNVQARGGTSITFMEVWVDGIKRFQTSGNVVSTSLTLGTGSYIMHVYGKSGSTVVSKASSSFTVK